MPNTRLPLAIAVLITALLAGCTANEPIRTAPGLCAVASTSIGPTAETPSSCQAAALEEVTVALDKPTVTGATTASYLLGYVEFDDEGKSWLPNQQDQIFDRMKQEADQGDVSIVIFVHGWKHNARENDGNVRDFTTLLDSLTRAEQQLPTGQQPRRVFGIYTGWRGESGPAGLVDNLTFWTRKSAAERVAEGNVRGLLGRARAFRDTLNAHPAPGRNGTRMLTIGHSFGGLIVYSALQQYFVDRAAESLMQARYFPDALPTDHARERATQARPAGPREIAGYGDLVVLVNPAFEAMRYEPIRELVTAYPRGVRTGLPFAPRQSPVLVEVTSVGDSLWDGDWATGIAFPLGRAVNTGLERTRPDKLSGEHEETEILKAVGHYEPFWTHDLNGPATAPPKGALPIVLDAKTECAALAQFEKDNLLNGALRPGWQRTFADPTGLTSVLTQGGKGGSDPANPFWIVRAHVNVIKDHDDISNPVFESFVTKLYQDIELRKHPACTAG